MSEALNREQLLDAQRLQRRGLTLREIAGELGVSFQAVCLGLYGDNQSTGRVAGETGDGKDDARHAAGGDGAGHVVDDADDADAHRGAGVGVARLQETVESAAEAAGPAAVTVSEARAAPAAAQPHRQAEPPRQPAAVTPTEGKPDDAIDAERAELLRQFHPGQRFRLVSEDGQSLHQSLHVLTRLPNFFWRGTGEQLSAVRRRKPEWAYLKPVAVS